MKGSGEGWEEAPVAQCGRVGACLVSTVIGLVKERWEEW